MTLDFDRASWARLGGPAPSPLVEAELAALRGVNEPVSIDEVAAIYTPLSSLLGLVVDADGDRDRAVEAFLDGRAAGGAKPRAPQAPVILGIAGSVAVGKSTFARVLREMVSRLPAHPRVALVTTDGFLYPNRVLETRGLLARKGFPESYDVRRLVAFLTAIARGDDRVEAPVYSHQAYDIVSGEVQAVDRPDVVIIEGLNVLQARTRPSRVAVSAFFHFSMYLDAAERDIETWYVDRFLALRETVFRDPRSYFHRYTNLTDAEARRTAHEIWRTINGVNLRENIAPTREHADLLLEKAADHAVHRVRLRARS